MSYLTKYDLKSGAIISLISSSDIGNAITLNRDANSNVIEGKGDPKEQWVDGLSLSARTAAVLSTTSPAYELNTVVTVTGVPNNAWVSVSGVPAQAGTTGFTVTRADESYVTVELVGAYKSNLLRIDFKSLASAKTSAQDVIDKGAEAARASRITEGSGQAMTYMRKAEAARLFLAGTTLSAPQQARIDHEATRLGVTATQAAQQLVTIADGWEALDASIDFLRLTTKANIAAATTLDQIASIVSGVVWP